MPLRKYTSEDTGRPTDDRIQVVVDGLSSVIQCSNAGVHLDYILSYTIYLLLMKELILLTSSPIHSLADNNTLHASYSSSKPVSIVIIGRPTSSSASAHSFTSDITIRRTNDAQQCDFARISIRYIFLPSSIFPESYNYTNLRSKLKKHIRSLVHDVLVASGIKALGDHRFIKKSFLKSVSSC